MPRSIWTGTLQFVLISLPVKLYKSTDDKGVSFKNLHAVCGHNINLKKWCNICGGEVPANEINKGYELGKNQFVIFTQEEIDNFLPENEKAINIEAAVKAEEIPVITYDTSYFIAPDKGGEHVYNLLLNALAAKNKVLIGRVVMRNKEHLVSIRPYQDGLLMSNLHFINEVRDIHEVVSIKDKNVNNKELELAVNLMDTLTGSFDKIDQVDKYKTLIEEMVEKKASGQIVTIEPTKPVREVKNLIEGLQKSIEIITGAKVAKPTIVVTPTHGIPTIDATQLLKMPEKIPEIKPKEGIKEQLVKMYGITDEEIDKIILEDKIEDEQFKINTLKELTKYASFEDYVKDHSKEFEGIEISEDFKFITILDKNYPRINIPILKKIGIVTDHFGILINIKSSNRQIKKEGKTDKIEDNIFEF